MAAIELVAPRFRLEKGPVVTLSTHISRDLKRRMRTWCIENDVQINVFVTQALTEALAEAELPRLVKK